MMRGVGASYMAPTTPYEKNHEAEACSTGPTKHPMQKRTVQGLWGGLPTWPSRLPVQILLVWGPAKRATTASCAKTHDAGGVQDFLGV